MEHKKSEWVSIKNSITSLGSNVSGHVNKYADLNSIVKIIKEKIGEKDILIRETEGRPLMMGGEGEFVRSIILEVIEDGVMVDFATSYMSSKSVQLHYFKNGKDFIKNADGNLMVKPSPIHPAQEQGMITTYMRRYVYQILLGVTDTKDLDDSHENPNVVLETCFKHPDRKGTHKLGDNKHFCDECWKKLEEKAKARQEEKLKEKNSSKETTDEIAKVNVHNDQ